jgi:cobalt-zinc-cadmium efflux system protein
VTHGRPVPVGQCTHSHGGLGGHPHGRSDGSRLRVALILTATFMVAEVVGGLVSNSLALLADAGHMLTDAGALALSLFVAWFGRQPATPQKSFGYLRWEILAALINGSVLLLVSGWVLWEAVARFSAPEPLDGGIMLVVAVVGLLVNVAAAAVLHPASSGSLNVRGAYLHVLGDLLGSVGTVTAALLVRFTGWLHADAIASVVVTLLIVRGAWRLVREAVDVLLEAVPAHISPSAVRQRLTALEGVDGVHDLHIWSVSTGLVAMSAHAVVPDVERHQAVLEQAHAALAAFGIHHVTLQLERRTMCEGHPHLHA